MALGIVRGVREKALGAFSILAAVRETGPVALSLAVAVREKTFAAFRKLLCKRMRLLRSAR